MAGNESLPHLPDNPSEGQRMPIRHEDSAFERAIQAGISELTVLLNGPDEERARAAQLDIDAGLDLLNQYKREHPDG